MKFYLGPNKMCLSTLVRPTKDGISEIGIRQSQVSNLEFFPVPECCMVKRLPCGFLTQSNRDSYDLSVQRSWLFDGRPALPEVFGGRVKIKPGENSFYSDPQILQIVHVIYYFPTE
jgi:hypothetical protein